MPKRISYAETKGGWVYDWPTIIDDLEERRYAHADYAEVMRAACSWVTCACGNQCAAIPRFGDSPNDYTLNNLGIDFARAIGWMDPDASQKNLRHWAKRARTLLKQIEDRASKILNEMEERCRAHRK